MKFLYNTMLGRFILKIFMHTKLPELLAGWLNSSGSRWMIKPYIKMHNIDMLPYYGQEYNSFGDFFARKKREGCFATDSNVLISPCDGRLTVTSIKENDKFFIKNSWYSIYDLVQNKTLENCFKDGLCMIFRLQADDYHHFCYIDNCYHGKGNLIPGKIHSVQPIALEKEPVFRMNKRMWSVMDTMNFGLVVQVEVGAVLIGGMVHELENKWANRGDEMGHFELCGSTVILLFQKEIKDRLHFAEGMEDILDTAGEYPVRMGSPIGYLKGLKTI